MVESLEFLAPSGKSDHLSLLLNIELVTQINVQLTENVLHNKANGSLIKEELDAINWDSVFSVMTLKQSETNSRPELLISHQDIHLTLIFNSKKITSVDDFVNYRSKKSS